MRNVLYALRAIYLGQYGFTWFLFIAGLLVGTFYSEEAYKWWGNILLALCGVCVWMLIKNKDGLARLGSNLRKLSNLLQVLLAVVGGMTTSALVVIAAGFKETDPFLMEVASSQLPIRILMLVFGILGYPWILWVIDQLNKEASNFEDAV